MNLTSSQIQEMPLTLEPGEIVLYLDLHRIENISPIEAIKLAESLGFEPQLRYRTWQSDDGTQVGIYALLHYERRNFDSALEANYATDEQFETLAARIVPDTAVHFTYRLKKGRSAA
jgi:hypothetical protein